MILKIEEIYRKQKENRDRMKKEKKDQSGKIISIGQDPDSGEMTPEQDNNNYYKRVSRHQLIMRVTGMVLFVCLVGFMVFQIFFKSAGVYENILEIWESPIVTVSSQQYEKYGNGVLQYGINGAAWYNSKAEMKWNCTFEISSPKAVSSGDYIVIYNVGGKEAVLLDPDGIKAQIVTDQKITKAVVSKAGVSAYVTEGEKSNDIVFFNKDGEKLEIKIHTLMSESGYPCDISFSPDGQMLCASFVYLDSGVLQDQIVFYNFNEGITTTGRTVGAFRKYDDTLFPDVVFLKENRVAALGDGKIVLYSLKNKISPEELKVIDIEQKMKLASYCEDYIACLTENSEGENSGHLTVYNTEGKEVLNQDTDFKAEKIQVDQNGVYLIGTNEICYYAMNGKLRYRGDVGSEIIYLCSGNRENELLVVTNQKIRYIRLV